MVLRGLTAATHAKATTLLGSLVLGKLGGDGRIYLVARPLAKITAR